MFITSVFKQLYIGSSLAITLLLVCSRSVFLLTSQRNHDSIKQSHHIMLMDLVVQKFRQDTDGCLCFLVSMAYAGMASAARVTENAESSYHLEASTLTSVSAGMTERLGSARTFCQAFLL